MKLSIAKGQIGTSSLPSTLGRFDAARCAGRRFLLFGSVVVLTLASGCGKAKKPTPSEGTGVTAKANLATPKPCDRAHTLWMDHDGKDGLDLVCNDRRGRHAVALRKPDHSFVDSPGWWPSATTGWCDRTHLKFGDFNGDLKADLSCHRADGKHQIALSNGDGTFSEKAWWPSEPGKELGWCEPAHLKLGYYDEDDKLDLGCHTKDGKHAVALSNGDGTFVQKPWWPSEPGSKGPGWCDPANLRVGVFNHRNRRTVDLSCHSEDGKHLIAFNKGNGVFAPGAWWPSAPGKGEGWCDPTHLKFGAYTANRDALDMSCHSDGGHLLAFNNGDGTFTPKSWWPGVPGKGEGWCDLTSLSMGRISADKTNRFHLFCHSKDGKHLAATNNGDGTFTARSWWPSQPGKDVGWCDPAHLDLDNSDKRSGDMNCRADDGRVLFAAAQPDGTFIGSASHLPKWPN